MLVLCAADASMICGDLMPYRLFDCRCDTAVFVVLFWGGGGGGGRKIKSLGCVLSVEETVSTGSGTLGAVVQMSDSRKPRAAGSAAGAETRRERAAPRGA